eukprot:1930444-Alexandrium_andersonii.AAC.1
MAQDTPTRRMSHAHGALAALEAVRDAADQIDQVNRRFQGAVADYATARRTLALSLIHISEPTRLALI